LPQGGPALAGVRVLEVGHGLASPYSGMQLADMGARVIKVENPAGGDMIRLTGPFVEGESANYMRVNRNKHSLAMNLKAPEGKAILRRLVADADIMLENFRPGTMADLGLDYPSLAHLNRRLIYVAASGWGQDGRRAALAGVDLMAQAMSGLMSIAGEPGRPPVAIGIPVCDLVTALYGTIAALAALHERAQSGLGQYIDVCLLETGVALSVLEAGTYFTTGEIPRPKGSAHQTNAPYQAVRAADGWFTIGATSNPTWSAFCDAMGLQHLERDTRFATNDLRRQNREELIGLIEEVTATAERRHWIEVLEEAGVPCAPIRDYGQVFNDPELNARGFFVDLPHSSAGAVRQAASPMRFSRSQTQLNWSGPRLGEHSLLILEELGYTESERRRLVADGVVVVP